ncbi:helix-turn-helix domain-containing protein [uncultured Robinsoniella sp.]|uniref:helix-turn-helix domain-containing protein n=1 Tax=uncultured Robinsoniella sp. TaxID=904190 RepID=UPI00374EB689
MYRKTTFSKEIIGYAQESIADREIIRSENMDRSHLILFDDTGSLYQFFDINMPYLVIYESVNIGANTMVYQEFSENNKILKERAYTDLADQTRKLHSHNFYELTFVLSGRLTMRIEDENIMYNPGDCCLCNRNIHHMELMDQDTEIVLFLIKEDYVHDVFDTNYYYDRKGSPHLVGTIFDVFFSENKKNPLYDAKVYADYRMLYHDSLEPLLTIMNQMITEISGTHSGKSHMMKALLCRFFEMLENDTIYQEEVHWARLSNEEQIIYQITEAYKKKNGIFTREEIEKITGYNGDHVERIVKRHTGKTLLAYGREFLVQKAAELLRDTDLSIVEICEQLGYSNRYYFNKIFTGKYGVTPSVFRQKIAQS